MRLTGMGKFVLFILAVGLAMGGWKLWQQKQSAGSGPNSGPNNGAGGGQTGETGGGVDIPFVITAAKQDWVGDQVAKFNAAHNGKWRITTEAIPSREAMHAILKGKTKPVLWSPGSPIWPARLAEAWKGGGTILDMSDPNGYRVFLRTPLVFLTTRDKAKFLRPLLGSTQPWVSLRRLCLGQIKCPWGTFRFSHADPLTSSSGMLTLGLMLYDFGQRSGQGGALEKLAEAPTFRSYMTDVKQGFVYDAPAEKGTTALTKAFLEDTRRYDVITAYESAALDAAANNPDLAVIYPNPTAVSEHAVSLLSGSWVTPDQRQGALEFLQFLGSKEALQDGLKYKFRPVQATASLTLAGELSRHAAQGFQQSYAPIELPPYQALNSAAFQWRIYVAHKPATDE